MAGAPAWKVDLPGKHLACIKMLCLLGWLDRDYDTGAFLPASPSHASERPLTWSPEVLKVCEDEMVYCTVWPGVTQYLAVPLQ